jgi:ABC-type glutathione transport system ATPase component
MTATAHSRTGPLLAVRRLTKTFKTTTAFWPPRRRSAVASVDDVSFEVFPGECFALVGESGSGKTTTARCILRAIEPSAGEILFRMPTGQVVDVARLGRRALKPFRRCAQMVFQDPFGSLNPRMTIREIVGEPLLIHECASGPEVLARTVDMLERVGLDDSALDRFPHAFSGGQRQRIALARALILRPSLLVCDEATSALDVSVQAQVLELLRGLRRDFQLTCLFIAHNLDIVHDLCDRVAVMRAGRIVEMNSTALLFDAPQHPYTQLLLSALPSLDPDAPLEPNLGHRLARIEGGELG